MGKTSSERFFALTSFLEDSNPERIAERVEQEIGCPVLHFPWHDGMRMEEAER